jgi:hypothetical protein
MFAAALSLACPLEWSAHAQSLDMANPAFQDPVTGCYYFYDAASGYYYDQESGYYYDPQANVFYASSAATDSVPESPVPLNSVPASPTATPSPGGRSSEQQWPGSSAWSVCSNSSVRLSPHAAKRGGRTEAWTMRASLLQNSTGPRDQISVVGGPAVSFPTT